MRADLGREHGVAKGTLYQEKAGAGWGTSVAMLALSSTQ